MTPQPPLHNSPPHHRHDCHNHNHHHGCPPQHCGDIWEQWTRTTANACDVLACRLKYNNALESVEHHMDIPRAPLNYDPHLVSSTCSWGESATRYSSPHVKVGDELCDERKKQMRPFPEPSPRVGGAKMREAYAHQWGSSETPTVHSDPHLGSSFTKL